MLPIATVQGVRDGISTGMIVDLSEYLKKTEGVSKEEHAELESVVSTKLDAEPIHKHHIEDIKQLQNILDGKYDKGEKYSYNVILSDSEKIPFLESPTMLSMEIANKFDVEGYKLYVDDASGDLMIVFNDVLIGSYSKSGNKWVLNGITETLQNSMNNYATKDHVHDEYATKYMVDEQTLIEKVNIVNPEDFVLECTTNTIMSVYVTSNYSLLNTKVEVVCNVSGVMMTRVITIEESETDISVDDNSYIESISYNDSDKKITIIWTLRVLSSTGTAKVIESTHTETQVTNIKTKINELETVVQNQQNNFASVSHSHDEYATVSHSHDEYATKEHTHNTFDNAITFNQNATFAAKVLSNEFAAANNVAKIYVGGDYMTIQTYCNSGGGVFIEQMKTDKTTVRKRLDLIDGNGNSTFPGDLTAKSNLKVNGNTALSGDLTVKGTNILTKITELEAILQNHYQALMLLLEKHDLVDTNTNDGANITPSE